MVVVREGNRLGSVLAPIVYGASRGWQLGFAFNAAWGSLVVPAGLISRRSLVRIQPEQPAKSKAGGRSKAAARALRVGPIVKLERHLFCNQEIGVRVPIWSTGSHNIALRRPQRSGSPERLGHYLT